MAIENKLSSFVYDARRAMMGFPIPREAGTASDEVLDRGVIAGDMISDAECEKSC